MAFRCMLCNATLEKPSKRRVLCASTTTRESSEYKIFRTLVQPNFIPSSTANYVCKNPCFATLGKLHRHATAVNNLLGELGLPILSAWRPTTSSATNIDVSITPQSSITSNSRLLDSESPLVRRGVKRLCEEPLSPFIRPKRHKESKSPSTGTKFPLKQRSRFAHKKGTYLSRRKKKLSIVRTTTPQHQSQQSAPSSTLLVNYMRGNQSIRKYRINSPFKNTVKSMRYKQPIRTVRSVFKSSQLSKATLKVISSKVSMECKALCKDLPSKSLFKLTSIDHLRKFNIDAVSSELSTRAPILFSVIKAAATPPASVHKPNMNMITTAAAVLLKARSQKMCAMQSLIGSILYSGHAAKRVHTRLQKLGICASHKATMENIRSMGVDYNAEVLEWRDNLSALMRDAPSGTAQTSVAHSEHTLPCQDIAVTPHEVPSEVTSQNHSTEAPSVVTSQVLQSSEEGSHVTGLIIVGDNVDNNIAPSDMRVDHQVKSIHQFHYYVAPNRVQVQESMQKHSNAPQKNIQSLPTSTFLPSASDCVQMKANYTILAERIVVDEIPCFHHLKDCCTRHIKHPHSDEMEQKSNPVPMGVVPENENTREGILKIMQELHKIVPQNSSTGDLMPLIFMGDQLTVERARSCKEARVNSSSTEDALLGLEPAICDWHAEANFIQILFNRLYKGGSNLDYGTLLQLRNLIDRRNVSTDTSGKFNQSNDFLELMAKCHVIAATMNYFGMSTIDDHPTCNMFPTNVSIAQQWKHLHIAVGEIIERYVFVREFTLSASTLQLSDLRNPHSDRIVREHSYAQCTELREEPSSRVLPKSIVSCADFPNPSANARNSSPDKVLDYACSVMTDGLLLLELRDGIHEGDGERLRRCWKFMLLYFYFSNHRKYALEALKLQAAISATASERLAQELLHCRFINVQGGAGMNLPADLYMEHLNRTLKDYLKGQGANISEDSIVQAAKSLKKLMETARNFDTTFKVRPESLHHTKKSSKKDRDLVLAQLISSNVFSYIPGRFHSSFKNIKTHISDCINVGKLVTWIKQQQKNMANNIELQKIFHPKHYS